MARAGVRLGFLALSASLLCLIPNVARAAAFEQPEAYIMLGGGGHHHLDGVDSGTRPAATVGAGVSFGWLSLEANTSWTRLEWQKGSVCIQVVGVTCDPIPFEGDAVGFSLQARLTPFDRGSLLRPYLAGGAGGAYLDFRSDRGGSDSSWGLGLVAGGGLEVEVFGDLAVDLAVMYSWIDFKGEVHPLSSKTESVLFMGTIRYYL